MPFSHTKVFTPTWAKLLRKICYCINYYVINLEACLIEHDGATAKDKNRADATTTTEVGPMLPNHRSSLHALAKATLKTC